MLNKYPLPTTFLIAVFLFSAIPESQARPPTKWEQLLAEKKQLKREYDPQIRENQRKWERVKRNEKGQVDKEYRKPIKQAKHNLQERNRLTKEMNAKKKAINEKYNKLRDEEKAAIQAEWDKKKELIEKKYGFYKPGR